MAVSYALVTGASSGLGAEFARQLAAHGLNVVLVARRQSALEEVAAEIRKNFGVETEVLPADLSLPDDVARVCARMRSEDSPVTYLVNNAGFGVGKSFVASPLETHLQQIDVLVKAPLALMHTALEVMGVRQTGTIINVCSTAAFTPGGTYSAAKRALLVLSQSASLEYKNQDVQVTAVNPGLTRSNFHRAMGESAPRLPKIFWLEPSRVVREALEAADNGKASCTPSLTYKLLTGISRALPPGIVAGGLSKTRDY